MLGIHIPPFDMIWLIETIWDHVQEISQEKVQRKVNNDIKANRLLYELGEITKAEYERRKEKLNRQWKMGNKINRTSLNQRVNLLG